MIMNMISILHVTMLSLFLVVTLSTIVQRVDVENTTEQDQVNPNGETYPVGVFISNYAASWAAQYLGAALIQVREG